MKQALADIRSGKIIVREVPVPARRPGFVLVKNSYSLISTGTELGTLKLGRKTALGKARSRPEQAAKLIELARAQGPLTAYRVAQRALDTPIALGYSSSGVVVEADGSCPGFSVGQPVACAGQGWASHAEFICVPKRLCVPVPDSVSLEHAAFSTVGAIALQSLRIADARMGETIVVIGLGLVGLLACQLAKASGCHVVGLDVDSRRIDLVNEHKWAHGLVSNSRVQSIINGLTQGRGADSVIVTAATSDNGPVTLAGELCRKKGKVIIVGRTPLNAPRETYLFKELSLLTSMAYGPGTGDPNYEVNGHDYPLAYVRFTEERNIETFLRQLELGNLVLDPLITHRVPIDQAPYAYAALEESDSKRGIGVVLEYSEKLERASAISPSTLQVNPPPSETARSKVSLGIIGAGSYAIHELVPLLQDFEFERRVIVSRTGVNAEALARKHGFTTCSTNVQDATGSECVSAVMILTRHDSHADLVVDALKGGKDVFVEKPLALVAEDIERIRSAQKELNRVLMVGFNRRFAPLAQELKIRIYHRSQPLFIRYMANVGFRASDHWLHDPVQGGGVVVGEACHHLDFCLWLAEERLASVSVSSLGKREDVALPDTIHVMLAFENGSLANLSYVSNGSKRFPAELIEVCCGGTQLRLTDFRTLEWNEGNRLRKKRIWLASDKGHKEQMRRFVAACAGEEKPPSAESYLRSSEIAIHIARLAEKCKKGETIVEEFQ